MFFEKGETMSEEEKKFLEIVDLKKGFGSGETRQEVLRGMNFSVAKGEFCVLLGPSGSGKSTLLNIIGGIDSADCGYISINGDKLEDMSEKKLTQYRRKHLGYVFQMYNLIANLNVKENIEVGAYLSDNALDIDDLLHTLGLYEHRYKLPNQLSGGQQQRVSIGRAIVKNPDILLCDEPTGALDYNTSKEILKLIEDVNKKYGNTIIMYTAALANASKELEEAATMDGANLLQQIWYVELPAIKNIIVIQFILQAGNIMSIGFEKAYALQTDMNLPASEILSTYVYRIGLLNGDYGYSTAVGLFNSVINVILLIFVNQVVKKLNDGEGL